MSFPIRHIHMIIIAGASTSAISASILYDCSYVYGQFWTHVVSIVLTRHICIDILNNYKCIPQKSGAVAISSSILQNCLCAFNNLQSHPYTIEYSAALWWNCICVTRIYVRLESTIYMNSHTEWTTNLPQHLVAAHLRDAFVLKKKFMHLGRISKIHTTHVWNWICD